MKCLEKYRNKLVRKINQNLHVLLQKPDEDAVHDFRVGVKRLTAFYYLLHEIDPQLNAKEILKPYRALSKSIGRIRDGHIAARLVHNLDRIDLPVKERLAGAINTELRQNYSQFQKTYGSEGPILIRTRSIRACGVSETAILQGKPIVLAELLRQILLAEELMNATQWHTKRILLKRYHHTIEAFAYCSDHHSNQSEIKQIRMLEQLLGDWHDRVVTMEMLKSIRGHAIETAAATKFMQQQNRLLLGSARIYLSAFARWHEQK